MPCGIKVIAYIVRLRCFNGYQSTYILNERPIKRCVVRLVQGISSRWGWTKIRAAVQLAHSGICVPGNKILLPRKLVTGHCHQCLHLVPELPQTLRLELGRTHDLVTKRLRPGVAGVLQDPVIFTYSSILYCSIQ